MLMPIIAAVGSFVVSERILKPKATALFILACLGAYDVFLSPPTPPSLSSSSHSKQNQHSSNDSNDAVAIALSTATKIINDNSNNADDEFWDYDHHHDHHNHKHHTATTNTHNDHYAMTEEEYLATAMRCYRGPVLLAGALFCTAYALRMWRRNGVACDELLFLPGTPHEFRCSGSTNGGGGGGGTVVGGITNNSEQEKKKDHGSREGSREDISEIIDEGGNGIIHSSNDYGRGEDTILRHHTDTATTVEEGRMVSPIKSCFSEGDAAAGAAKSSLQAPSSATAQQGNAGLLSRSLDDNRPLLSRSRDDHHTQMMDASTPNDANDTDGTDDELERMPLMLESMEMESSDSPLPVTPPRTPLRSRLRSSDSPTFRFIREQALRGFDMLVVTNNNQPSSSSLHRTQQPSQTENNSNLSPTASNNTSSPVENEVYDAEYAPSAPSVLGAALDLSLPVLFNFHMFVVLMKDHYKKEIESNNSDVVDVVDVIDVEEEITIDHVGGAVNSKVDVRDDTWMKPPQVPPKVLPLFFITPLILRSMVPPRQRRRFFRTVLQGTMFSPFQRVRFRDAFVADCATSLVRPVNDLAYALAYYFTALFGLFSGKYDLNRAGYIMSKSMVWHGLIMPALSILPLFIKFLQTLRQAYDANQRWPYLGDAFKYFTAGLVILYGMTHAEGERSDWWLASFVLATLYQIAWDTLVDWELLVFVPSGRNKRMHSSSPSNHHPVTLASVCRTGRDALPHVRLRPKRLFGDDSFYWKALFANAALRFCWMTGFIPAYWVSVYTGSTQVTFVDKAHGWSFVVLASLEIIRRSIWGIIKVELETIKLTSGDENELTTTSSGTDENLREGKWKLPRDELTRIESPPCKSRAVKCKWRFRFRLSKIVKPTAEEDTRAGGGQDSSKNQNQYSKLEQSESASPLEIPKKPSEKQKKSHRWLCFSVSSGFLRWLLIMELLFWLVAFLVASYYVVLAE